MGDMKRFLSADSIKISSQRTMQSIEFYFLLDAEKSELM